MYRYECPICHTIILRETLEELSFAINVHEQTFHHLIVEETI